ncbi:MAG: DUF6542 domain-containing protein [Marmoricola sp.]
MRAPTVWEEGRWSGDRVTRLAVLACLLLLATDLLLGSGLGPLFGTGFVLVCIGAALAVRPGDFYRIGVLPPPLLLSTAAVGAAVARDEVAPPGDSYLQAVIGVVGAFAGPLLLGYLAAGGVVVLRYRILERRAHA